MSTAAYLDMLLGAEPDSSYLELRWRLLRGRGMGREFYPVRHPKLGTAIAARGHKTDLYAGVAPRVRRAGTRDAVERVHVLWADLDTPEAIGALGGFHPPPSMIVRSGGGRHCYWALWPPAAPGEVERANRRLAHVLGGDPRATDAARILRPPGTFNFKTGEPVPVTVEHMNADAIYTLEEVVGHLPDPPTRKPAHRAVTALVGADDPLRSIPPTLYVEALTGRQVPSDGKVCCPLPGHDDSIPSFHVYDDPDKGWCCFGCGRGGTIIDLGAALFSIEPRGSGYHEIRRRLEVELRTRAAA